MLNKTLKKNLYNLLRIYFFIYKKLFYKMLKIKSINLKKNSKKRLFFKIEMNKIKIN